MKRNQLQGKYIYRFGCGAILTGIAAALFLAPWYDFVEVNNQTGHLLGLVSTSSYFAP